MGPRMSMGEAYKYHKMDLEKTIPEESEGSSTLSETEGLLRDEPMSTPHHRPSRNVRRYLKDPCVAFIIGGCMFSILIILGITTLALIQSHASSSLHKGHGSHAIPMPGHKPGQHSENRNAKGLRTTPDGKLIECGATAREAEENGCPFDAFAFSYVPPACYEEDLSQEALSSDSYLAPWAAGEFPWYKWSNFTEPVPQKAETLSKYKNLWTNNAWHKAHCLYEWRLIARALHKQARGHKPVYVLKRALEIAHVDHCNQMVSDPLTKDESPIWSMRNVGRCIRIDENEDDWEEPELNF